MFEWSYFHGESEDLISKIENLTLLQLINFIEKEIYKYLSPNY